MQKLIKLSDTHYIVVDDSEIKEGDYYWAPIKRSIEQCIKKILVVKDGENDIVQYKITHSTEPLEEDVVIMGSIPKITLRFLKIKKLSLSDVEEVINGYSAENTAKELAIFYVNNNYPDSIDLEEKAAAIHDVIWGFNAHKKLVKDRLVDSINDTLHKHRGSIIGMDAFRRLQKDIVDILTFSKTEWNCKVVDGKIELI